MVPLIICLERGAAIWAHEFGIYIKWNILNTKYMMKHCTTLLPSLRLTFQRQVGREFDCYWADKMSSTSPQLANLKYGQVPSKYSPFALYIIYPNQSYSAALRTFNVEVQGACPVVSSRPAWKNLTPPNREQLHNKPKIRQLRLQFKKFTQTQSPNSNWKFQSTMKEFY